MPFSGLEVDGGAGRVFPWGRRRPAHLPGQVPVGTGPVAVSCPSRDGPSEVAVGSRGRGDIRAPPGRTTTLAIGCRWPSALHGSYHRAWLTPPLSHTQSTPNADSARMTISYPWPTYAYRSSSSVSAVAPQNAFRRHGRSALWTIRERSAGPSPSGLSWRMPRGQIATQSPEANPRENFLLYLQGHLRGAGPYGLDVSSEGRTRAAEGK